MIDILITEYESFILTESVKAVSDLSGDIVEVGVYKGGSAELICKEKGDKVLHLFDTWEGIVSTSPEDLLTHSRFSPGRYLASLEETKKRLEPYSNVLFYKGEFPETYQNNIDKISLLNLDVDLYKPTKFALEILWDKIEVGGIIVLHDYPFFEAVRLVVDNFLADKEYTKIQTFEKSQAIIIKLKQ